MAVEDQEQQEQRPKRIKSSHSCEASDDPQSVPVLLQDIIVEILSKLPVESLLRCKSVCKSWRSLISDPHFIKSHLNLSANDNHYAHNRLTFSTVPKINLKSCSLYDVLYDKQPLNVFEHDYPMKHSRKSVWIVGSCNGLLCICIEEGPLFIWNPSTRKSNRLPYSGCKTPGFSHEVYGFGYLESIEDYKVVKITFLHTGGASFGNEVKIFSLRNGNWKKISDFPSSILLTGAGISLNGALHWDGYKDPGPSQSFAIVSLDLSKETYVEVLQPLYDEGEKDLFFGNLGESLCVVCSYHGRKHTDVWVMNVYGVKDSWTKLVSIPYLSDIEENRFSMPVCISNDGKILLQFGSKLIVCDSKISSFSEIQNLDGCLEACTFVESLVSPMPPTGTEEEGNL